MLASTFISIQIVTPYKSQGWVIVVYFAVMARQLARQNNCKARVGENQPDLLNSINLNHHYITLP
jgi:hypothetical protein